MKHARLSASGSHRWLTCPASIQASDGYPNTSNASADWGTACHEVGEKLLKGEPIPKKVGSVEVDAEIIEIAEEYANYCNDLKTGKKLTVEMIEETFSFNHIVPEGFGTSDYTLLTDTTLHIVDLKTGHHLVDAEDNPQLKLYAIGALRELADIYDVEEVVLHIIQNRANHFSSWATTPDELAVWGEWVRERAELALSNNPPFNPEHKACQWCPHQANCEALRLHVESVVTGDFDDISDIDGKADKISAEHVKKVLDNADLIKGFVSAVQDRALELMESGVEIKGYKLVEARTNRRWRDEKEVEALLSGKNIYEQKLKPMTKLLKEFKDVEGLEDLLIKPEGAPTIAPETDKRPAIGATCNEFDDLS